MGHNPPFKVTTSRIGRLGTALLLLCAVWGARGPVRAWGDADGPTLVKTSVHINVSQRSIYKPAGPAKDQSHTTCWVPVAKFQARGPVTAGGQFSVDFTRSDGSPWLHFDVPTRETEAGHTDTLETPTEGDLDSYEHKFTTAVGAYGFSIRYKNALEGTNQTLFTGKFRVGKVSESLGIPQMKNMYNFYVDHDWALPIGYVWFPTDDNPHLSASMWFRGNTDGAGIEGHLFYQGKEVATAGAPDDEVEHNTATMAHSDPRWTLMAFTFSRVLRTTSGNFAGVFFLDKNPGEYEIKVLRDGRLSRDAKFTIGDGGEIADTGIAQANHLATHRVLVPVKVLGTSDGPWKPAAWKTDAFYGNPLTGFTAP